MKPRALDLFCGAGGAGMGLHQAGFEIVGVDVKPQPRYPFEFHQADAMTFPLDGFDFIWASPPCQAYSRSMRHLSGPAEQLIDRCREMFQSIGCAWVIENVEGAPLSRSSTLYGDHGLMLCGTHFGLRIWRHRLFEASHPLRSPGPCKHDAKPLNPHREESRRVMRREFPGMDLEEVWRAAAGVPWMDRQTGRQAIPPAYSKFIGEQMMPHVLARMERAA